MGIIKTSEYIVELSSEKNEIYHRPISEIIDSKYPDVDLDTIVGIHKVSVFTENGWVEVVCQGTDSMHGYGKRLEGTIGIYAICVDINYYTVRVRNKQGLPICLKLKFEFILDDEDE